MSEITLTVVDDLEYSADEFWAEFTRQFPYESNAIQLFDEVDVDSKDWAAIRRLPGFSTGPDHAPVALYVLRVDATPQVLLELGKLTTRDEAGRHFTQWSRYWQELEDAGLIEIDRPVHGSTGIPYSQEYWTLQVTQLGQETVDKNPRIFIDVAYGEEPRSDTDAGVFLINHYKDRNAGKLMDALDAGGITADQNWRGEGSTTWKFPDGSAIRVSGVSVMETTWR